MNLIASDSLEPIYEGRLPAFHCLLPTHLKRWPICSVPKAPMPLRRKLKTKRFSLRRPTLKVKYWPTTVQQSQAWPTVAVELMSEEPPLPGRFWKSKKKEAPPNIPRLRSPTKTDGLHCEPCKVPGSLPRRSLYWN